MLHLAKTALRMFIMQVLVSQLHFLANSHAELAVPPLHNNKGTYAALLSGLTLFIPYTVLKLYNTAICASI